MVKQDWFSIDEGRTIGTEGTEQGIILQDEEYVQGARITLEQCHYPPFAITCGIYGWMVHTTFASSMNEAREKLEAMKKSLEEIYQLIPTLDDVELEAKIQNVTQALEAFVSEF
ncbi:hypothetical protein KDH_39890 [Dictyobacter sp. S3.2.2.5]|uniref:Uncharacterized protein n=1 Tax=Dictyobacter halimunensis TaxID=3026934 RepID=A0ABQ6FV69_9CHLR|nr:hypothetical protein KDH_39890 [Dictyobacter sp. S3.2.2.5]